MTYPFPVTSPYGPRTRGDGFHDGVDWGTPAGTVLHAPHAGRVQRFSNSAYGWGVRILLGDGDYDLLGHLSAHLVADGVRVEAGQPVARSGGVPGHPGAGNSTGPHLHHGSFRGGRWVDPIPAHVGQLWGGDMPLDANDKEFIRNTVTQAVIDITTALAYGRNGPMLPDGDIADRLRAHNLKLIQDALATSDAPAAASSSHDCKESLKQALREGTE